MLGDTMITLIGELVADPELRKTSTGTPVCNFTVTSPRRRYDRDAGCWQAALPLILRCTIWRGQAENFVASLREGDRLIVHGRLRPRTFTTSDGASRTALELEIAECGPSLLHSTAVPAPSHVHDEQDIDVDDDTQGHR
ncbi:MULTISPECIES: single-stranded DNA-binding protein [unclassified Crossiella]|uniref:single-stranded DNA-binding protein n=1 Tax=unclassified Crossiella TaxID=2620835 RepID=UPI001FFEA16A|nr:MULTISPECIES: single-stranded DNA-binding protein [unclassified Crossiella]MCK2240962.1 single-stranded DNA-binding protein [Crossiella sp. S99.2]MCK2253894.1 single-stranded DNA-binding protein [Crossiella sp. S99.1]